MRYLLFLFLSGCASVQPTIDGYRAAAKTSYIAAQDAHVEILRSDICNLPWFEIQKNPWVAQVVEAACLQGASTPPSRLLEEVR